MGEQVAARIKWGLSSVGRAPALQAGGREFESLRLHTDDCMEEDLNRSENMQTSENKSDGLIAQPVRAHA